jgi:undecaprenyl-diphosphatase
VNTPAAHVDPGPARTNVAGGSRDDGPSSRRGRTYTRWLVPLGLTLAYALFTVAVHLRLLDSLDVAVRHAARPGEVWGPEQIRAARLVNALQPTHLALLLGLVVTALSLQRRSLRPLGVMAVIGSAVVVVTLGTKWVMAHLDPGTVPVGHGSYPSGHAVFTVTAFGVAVLLLMPGSRWGWLIPAAMGAVMGVALVLAQVHPATDVMGAGLLAAAALASATAASLGRWASASRQRRVT